MSHNVASISCQGSIITDLTAIATIVNSDLIPFKQRGMYQAMQNGMFGFGAVAGASFGGSVADHIGWRWCFLLQVPISIFALVLGFLVVKNPEGGFGLENTFKSIWTKVDLSGAFVLVTGVTVQLLGLSLGGNQLPWGSPIVIGLLVASIFLLGLFLTIESRTTAAPVIPLRMFRGSLPVLTQIANVCAGLAAYAVCSMPPFRSHQVLHLTRQSSTCSCCLSSSRSSSKTQRPKLGPASQSLRSLPR